MALPLAVAADVFISALSRIRALRGVFNAVEMAGQLQQRFRMNDPADFFSFLNQVRNADRSYNAARQLPGDPTARIPERSHPVDPSVTERGYRYGYRVVIVADPGDGREAVETLVVVDSDTRLSPDEVRDRAAEMYSQQRFERKSAEKMRSVGPVAELTFYIVGIGRSR